MKHLMNSIQPRTIKLFCFAALFICHNCPAMAEIVYSDNLTHVINTPGLPAVRATNSTTLNVTAGAEVSMSYAESEGLRFDDTSIGNISGGVTHGASRAIFANESAVVNVSNG